MVEFLWLNRLKPIMIFWLMVHDGFGKGRKLFIIITKNTKDSKPDSRRFGMDSNFQSDHSRLGLAVCSLETKCTNTLRYILLSHQQWIRCFTLHDHDV